MSKKLKQIASIALPIIGTAVAPGLGTALGSTLSSAALAGIGGAVGGAAGGALNGGGVSGALKGGAIGGLGGYLSGGGFSDLLSGTSLGNGINSVSNAIGFGDVVSPAASAAREGVSSAATAAASPTKSVLSGYLPGGGGGAGGGSSGGFLSRLLGDGSAASTAAYSQPGLPWLNEVASGTLAPNAATGSLPWLSGVSSGTLAANPAVSGGSVLSRFIDNPIKSITSGAEDMLSTRNILKTAIPYALSRDNSRGFGQMESAARSAAEGYQPLVASGNTATQKLSDFYGLNGPEAYAAAMGEVQNLPGFQFARDQGVKALDASAASKGMLRSGNQEQAVQDFGTSLAMRYVQQYLDNLNQQQGAGVNAQAAANNANMTAAEAFAARKAGRGNLYNQALGLLSNYI
jgi:hypothetical protein